MEAGGIQIRQFVADAHQLGNLRGRQLTRLTDQVLGMIQQFRLGIALGGKRALVVERFSR
ncbi:hypothetical protein D3C78_1818480 [compost metagenome]